MLRQSTHKAAALVRHACRRHHRRSSSSSSSSSSFSSSQFAPLLVAAASTAFAGIYAVEEGILPAFGQKKTHQTNEDEEIRDKNPTLEHNKSSLASLLSSSVLAPDTSARTTSCEFLMPPQTPQFMTRQQTVEYLDRTAKPTDALRLKYEIERDGLLGVGSFGAVSKATCQQTGQTVAIKRLPKENTSDSAVQRELQALVAIRQAGGHPSLTALREHFDDPEQDSYYLVMDLVAGGELFDALCRGGPLSEADAARFLRQMASALQFLHSLNLVHADLKPENCMLSHSEPSTASLKLVDFGCCQLSSGTAPPTATSSPTRRFFGSGSNKKTSPNENGRARTAVTPAYCPPEVLAELRKIQESGEDRNPQITPEYDMWSLGVILFVMLVGAHPFDLKGQCTDEEIAQNVFQARVLTQQPGWHKHIGHLSSEVQDLLKRLMNPDPKKRLAAEDLLKSDWVRGFTASSAKLRHSDSRLAAYRKHQTRVAAQFFKRMLQHSGTGHGESVKRRSSNGEDTSQQGLLEAAFSKLDAAGRGYISSKELHGDTSWLGADAKLNLTEASELLSQTQMKDHYFPAGHVIYHEGDPGDVMYFIHSGTLEAKSKDGYVKTKQAGDFFGEDVLNHSEENAYAFTARCVTPVHAIQIRRKDYEKYLKEDEDLALMKEHGRIRRRERASVLLNMEKKTKQKSFVQGDILFERGSPGNNLYVLLEGSVDISVEGQKVRSLRKGEMTGEHAAYYGHKPYNVTAQCVSDTCVMGSLSGKELRKALGKNPVLQESFHDIIMRRDFKKALCAHLQRPFPETEEEMEQAFRALVPEDGPPELELEALRKMMKAFDPSYTDDDILTMLASMDLNGSNSLTWSEFKAIFAMAHEG